MDRDKRWERVKLAYDALVNNVGDLSASPQDAIKANYDNGITDEFIKPIIVCDNNQNAISKIQDGDVIIFFNFRTDRGRQLTEALSQKDFHEQNMHKLDLHYVTMTNYDESFKNVNVIYEKDNLTDTLGEVVSKNNKDTNSNS